MNKIGRESFSYWLDDGDKLEKFDGDFLWWGLKLFKLFKLW